jgi:hypothetical protein
VVLSLAAASPKRAKRKPKRAKRKWTVAVAVFIAAMPIVGASAWYAVLLIRHDSMAGLMSVSQVEAEPAVAQAPAIELSSGKPGSRLTLAILPFSNVSEYSDEEWLGDGFAEDIMTTVSRFRDLIHSGKPALRSACI